MNRKLSLNEEATRRMIEQEYGWKTTEEKELLMMTLKSLWGKDKPMEHNTMNNPEVLNKYMETMYPGRHTPIDVNPWTLSELEDEMNKCIKTEDYEGAAKYRDEIKKLKCVD
jgi:excinuclease UvrABC helicase subunit UvrB